MIIHYLEIHHRDLRPSQVVNASGESTGRCQPDVRFLTPVLTAIPKRSERPTKLPFTMLRATHDKTERLLCAKEHGRGGY